MSFSPALSANAIVNRTGLPPAGSGASFGSPVGTSVGSPVPPGIGSGQPGPSILNSLPLKPISLPPGAMAAPGTGSVARNPYPSLMPQQTPQPGYYPYPMPPQIIVIPMPGVLQSQLSETLPGPDKAEKSTPAVSVTDSTDIPAAETEADLSDVSAGSESTRMTETTSETEAGVNGEKATITETATKPSLSVEEEIGQAVGNAVTERLQSHPEDLDRLQGVVDDYIGPGFNLRDLNNVSKVTNALMNDSNSIAQRFRARLSDSRLFRLFRYPLRIAGRLITRLFPKADRPKVRSFIDWLTARQSRSQRKIAAQPLSSLNDSLSSDYDSFDFPSSSRSSSSPRSASSRSHASSPYDDDFSDSSASRSSRSGGRLSSLRRGHRSSSDDYSTF